MSARVRVASAVATLCIAVAALSGGSASGARAPDAVAGAGTTFIQAKRMHWSRHAGRALAVVRTTRPLTGLALRARARQSGR